MPDTSLPQSTEALPAGAPDKDIIDRAGSLYASDEVDVVDVVEDVVAGGAWVHALVWVPIDNEEDTDATT